MTYEIPEIEGEERSEATGATSNQWPLWEVFVRAKRGLNHIHVDQSTLQTPRRLCRTPATRTPAAPRE